MTLLPRRFLFISFVVVMLVSACSLTWAIQTPASAQPTAVSPSQNTSDYFPLKRGAYWIYQGTVKWTKVNSADVVEENITWKMDVVQVFRRGDIVGYEMIGAPWDLAWYDAGKEQSKYGIVQVGSKFYRVPLEAVARLSNAGDDLSGLVDENNMFLDSPLDTGKKFCDPVSLARSDNMYCWVVGERKPFEASGIKGVDPSKGLWEYPIVNQTMPDISTMCFVPGVGISHYSYHHNGTVSDVDVQLIEYYPGE
jgi:hypothetical protein